MKVKKLFVLIPTLLVAVIAVSGLAISGTTYTWEKTFEVSKPEVECKIEISDCRVVGCPVKVWVILKLDGSCRECYRHECIEKTENECRHWEDGCYYQINGTYSVSLYWWNGTQEDWQHVMYLQEEANITLSCWKHVETYTFIPMLEGSYKVIVTFETDMEAVNFSSED